MALISNSSAPGLFFPGYTEPAEMDMVNVSQVNPYRGGKTAATAGSATTLTVTKPTGTVAGEFLTTAVTTAGGYTLNTLSGWTLLGTSTGTGTGVELWVYYKIATGSEPSSYTWTVTSATTIAITCQRWSGINITTPVDSYTANNGNGGTSTIAPAALTYSNVKSAANLAVLFCGARPDSAGTPVITMPTSGNYWTAPTDGTATDTVNTYGSTVATAYKVNGLSNIGNITTAANCEFGQISASFNVSYNEVVELDQQTNVFSPLFTDLNNWNIGTTSSYPGDGPTNTGDAKLDYISPSYAPTSGGVFSADLGSNSPLWNCDFATTEFSTDDFTVHPGDTVEATVTLGSDQGAWPAIWTWASGQPGNGEIDLFEYHPDNPTLLELSNHVRPAIGYINGIVTAGTPFNLKVYFGTNSCRWYVNGALVFDDHLGVPDTWWGNINVNMSVSDGTYHAAPSGGQTHMQYTVTNFIVRRGSGQGAEAGVAVPLQTNVSSSDTGAGAETSGISQSSTDTMSGADTGSIHSASSSSDTGSGADANSNPAFVLADTASGADTGTMQAAVPSADTVAGAETFLLSMASADTFSGADTGSVHVAFTTTDTFTGADASIISVASSDTMSGADTGVLTAAINSADTSTSADATVTLNPVSSDSATGVEAASIGATFSASDTESTTSTESELVMVPSVDTINSVIAESVHVTVSDTDIISSLIVESLNTPISSTDTSTSVDGGSVHVAVPATDTGSGTEVAIIGQAQADSFAGVGVESATAVLSSVDSLTGVENPALSSAVLSDTDTAAFTDQGTGGLASFDFAAGSDFGFVTILVSSADTATGIEGAVVALVSADSSNTATDAFVLSVPAKDNFVGTDIGASGARVTSADTVTSVGAEHLANQQINSSDLLIGSDQAVLTVVVADIDTFMHSHSEGSVRVWIFSGETITGIENTELKLIDSDRMTATETSIFSTAFSSSDIFEATSQELSIRVAPSKSEAFVGSDNSFVSFLLTDVSHSVDAFSLGVKQSDNFIASEGAKIGILPLGTLEEFIHSSDAQANLHFTFADTSTSTSAVVSLNVHVVSETITVAEQASVKNMYPITVEEERGTFAENAFVSILLASAESDVVHGSETTAVGMKLTDTASLTDQFVRLGMSSSETVTSSIKEFIKISNMDSWEATETFNLGLHVTDSGTLADQIIGFGLSSTENITAINKEFISLSSSDAWDPDSTEVIGITVHDGGSSTDGQSPISAAQIAADQGTLNELFSVLIAIQPAADMDAGTLTEAEFISTVRDVLPVRNIGSQSGGVQPYYLRQRERWAIDNERQRHMEALYLLGEWTMFTLMWHMEDYNNGLVVRCERCFGIEGQAQTAQQRASTAYQNVNEYRCPDCFGTTFEGGFRAIIIRPAIFADTDEGQTYGPRGLANPGELDMESTPDFRVRSGDYCFRSTGDRYFLRVPDRITLRTGFNTPYQRADAIGYNHAKAAIQDPTSVSYTLPPNADDLRSILNIRDQYQPYNFSPYEIIKTPLIPVSEDQG